MRGEDGLLRSVWSSGSLAYMLHSICQHQLAFGIVWIDLARGPVSLVTEMLQDTFLS